MNCCTSCFVDTFLKEFIQANGNPGNCDYCKSENDICINPSELAHLFKPLIELYTPRDDFMPPEMMKEMDGEFIWDKLQRNWSIFNVDNKMDVESLIRSIFMNGGSSVFDVRLLDSYVEIESDIFPVEKKIDFVDSWLKLSDEIKCKNRYFHTIKLLEPDVLKTLLQNFNKNILSGGTFYRARFCEDGDKIPPRKMGMPEQSKAKGGRVNPTGIPYLYTASDLQTAIAEIRPDVGDKITVGKFMTIEQLSTIDLRDVSPFNFAKALDYEFAIQCMELFRRLSIELSKPISTKASELDYLPTQYICEFIKISGWDGVLYRSSLGQGYNIALFSNKKVLCKSTSLYQITKYAFEHIKV